MGPEAEEAKKEGNDCARGGKHIEAMLHYTTAIKLEPKEASLYSNRSLMFLKMQQYYQALEDAQTVIRLMPLWQKGYYRQGEVQFAAEHYQDALWSYKQALNIAPDDETLQKCVTKANTNLREQTKKNLWYPRYGLGMGLLMAMLVVIANEYVVEQSALESHVLKALVLVSISGIGYWIGVAYRFVVQNMRASMLEAPVDLLSDMKNSNSPSTDSTVNDSGSQQTSSSKPRARRSQASTRQRMKQAKS